MTEKKHHLEDKDVLDNSQPPQADQAVLEELQDIIDSGYDFADDTWSTGIVVRSVKDFINSHADWDSDKVRVSAASLIWTEVANTVDGKLFSANDLETKHGIAGTYGELISLKANLGDEDGGRALFEKNLDDIVSCAPHVIADLCYLSPKKTAAAISSFVDDYLSQVVAVGAIDVNSWKSRALNWYISMSLGSSRYGKRNLDKVIPVYEIQSSIDGMVARIKAEYDFNIKPQVDMCAGYQSTGGSIQTSKFILECVNTNLSLLTDPRCGVEGINVLASEYGIDNLYRYPAEILLRQLDSHGQSGPYGLIITAKADWNGAFSKNENILSVAAQLQEHGYKLRVVEVDSKRDIAKKLLRLKQMYPANKIPFLLFRAHGTESAIHLSDENNVILSDFSGENAGVKKVGTFFTEGSYTVLSSCSTGVQNGMANQMANFYGSKVIGPDAAASTEKIDIIFDEDDVIINVKVKYPGADANTYAGER